MIIWEVIDQMNLKDFLGVCFVLFLQFIILACAGPYGKAD